VVKSKWERGQTIGERNEDDHGRYVAEQFRRDFRGSLRGESFVGGATFWEKATILHAEFHRPTEKSAAGALSRGTTPIFMSDS